MIKREKIGLVLEGGGLRGMFTAGVIDYLMTNGITFDVLAGVSAGVLFGCNYKSNQPERAFKYNITYRDDPNYMSWRSWLKSGNYVNEKFSYHDLPYMLSPFDFVTFRNNPMELYAVCTDIEEGKPIYHRINDAEGDGLQWMRASASMPIFAKPVCIENRYYLDGGITDSVPLEFLQKCGCTKNIVVLTQPRGYRKKKSHLYLLLRVMLPKYPKVAQLMAIRHQMYNKQMEYVERQERKGNILVICPSKPLEIGRVEQDAIKMRKAYDLGTDEAMKAMGAIKMFLNI